MSAAVASVSHIGTQNDHATRVDAVTIELVSLSQRIARMVKKMLGYLKKGAAKLVGGALRKIQSMRARYRVARRAGKTKTEFVAREVAGVKVRAQDRRAEARHDEHADILDDMRSKVSVDVNQTPALRIVSEAATPTQKLIGDAVNTVNNLEFFRANIAFDLSSPLEVKVARMDTEFCAKVKDLYLSTSALWISLGADDETFHQMDPAMAGRMITAYEWMVELDHTINPAPAKKVR